MEKELEDEDDDYSDNNFGDFNTSDNSIGLVNFIQTNNKVLLIV